MRQSYLTKLFALACCVLCSWATAADPPGAAVSLKKVRLNAATLRVHFIDVGPGLAMLVQTPSGKNVFIDGGKWGLSELRKYVSHFVPKKARIDAAIVTHADLDHYKGMPSVLDAYAVSEFWYSGYSSSVLEDKQNWQMLLEKVDEEDGCVQYVPMEDYVSTGDVETIDDLRTPADDQDDIRVQYLNVDSDPPSRDPASGREFDEGQRRNNASLVFKIVYKQVSFLITGDINGRDKTHKGRNTDSEIDSEELELLQRHQQDSKYSLKSVVMQAPHHGSNGSCSLRFIEAVAPEWVVIPAGHQYNHPDPESLRRIRQAGVRADHILRTDEGDSTPEDRMVKDDTGDDSYVFETDGASIIRIVKVKVE